MPLAADVAAIFADARAVHGQALERLAQGDIRDAAEKAWCAIKRATDALILARTGEEPRTSGQTMQGLRRLYREGEEYRRLREIYAARQSILHGSCFYDGICEPEDDLRADITGAIAYVLEAEALSDSGLPTGNDGTP